MIIEFIVSSLWFILPAYFANAAPVFLKVLKHTHPIDSGKLFFDKRPILGNGKTWEGFLFAVFLGSVVGAIQTQFNSNIPNIEILMTLELAFLLSLGAMIGDTFASFFKRRIGKKRGESVFLLDQLDFVIAALVFASVIVAVPIYMWVVLFILTPLSNYLSNFIAYKLKLKDVWW
ncbi:MAG: CDP-2,3-bis-(O-geranylgeranyl)-sn-glycerol synthase [Candidatus Aenigmarchaeota archaeon]|nr:CDP-2,3-bis-(O-geranylgeranyl)-sn-glycerol synthase [Candidatus Aenigmarchaeota archaeon]